jgi:hypothetical protein
MARPKLFAPRGCRIFDRHSTYLVVRFGNDTVTFHLQRQQRSGLCSEWQHEIPHVPNCMKTQSRIRRVQVLFSSEPQPRVSLTKGYVCLHFHSGITACLYVRFRVAITNMALPASGRARTTTPVYRGCAMGTARGASSGYTNAIFADSDESSVFMTRPISRLMRLNSSGVTSASSTGINSFKPAQHSLMTAIIRCAVSREIATSTPWLWADDVPIDCAASRRIPRPLLQNPQLGLAHPLTRHPTPMARSAGRGSIGAPTPRTLSSVKRRVVQSPE